eukprot:PhM_4_TR17383/c1_g5_i2/m.32913
MTLRSMYSPPKIAMPKSGADALARLFSKDTRARAASATTSELNEDLRVLEEEMSASFLPTSGRDVVSNPPDPAQSAPSVALRKAAALRARLTHDLDPTNMLRSFRQHKRFASDHDNVVSDGIVNEKTTTTVSRTTTRRKKAPPPFGDKHYSDDLL